jgi:hypothetical protein
MERMAGVVCRFVREAALLVLVLQKSGLTALLLALEVRFPLFAMLLVAALQIGRVGPLMPGADTA